ncbi:MAG TPA: TM2 domain-containing protein [Gemmatimonadaceae bacterium]|nr:TM2 domain-containing protein [Gemmatimonadaceae bacterium]
MGTYVPARPTKYCQSCGTVIDAMAVVCSKCGIMQPMPPGFVESEKKILPALVLCFFFGIFGAHRFYAGKIGTGILQLVTLGGLGVWALIDFIMLTVGAFKDADGHKITEWV